MVAGCDASDSNHVCPGQLPASSGQPSRFLYSRVDPPPKAAPRVWISGKPSYRVPPVVEVWPGPENRAVESPRDPSCIKWTCSPKDWDGRLAIDTNRAPFEVVVTRYQSVGDDGLPRELMQRCQYGRGSEPCSICEDADDRGLVVDLRESINPDYPYMLIQLTWTNQSSNDGYARDSFVVLAVEAL